MIRSIVYFTSNIPGFGDSIRVKNDGAGIEHLLRVAAKNDDPTITLVSQGDKRVDIPVRLIALIRQA